MKRLRNAYIRNLNKKFFKYFWTKNMRYKE